MAYENYKKKGLITIYYIDGKEMVMLRSSGYVFTMEEFNKLEQERIEKDRKIGYNDRNVHYYDKWYRYNRWDEGKAYDEGVAKCVNEEHTEKWYNDDENFTIIEVIEATNN